jgi:hypothetical protein
MSVNENGEDHAKKTPVDNPPPPAGGIIPGVRLDNLAHVRNVEREARRGPNEFEALTSGRGIPLPNPKPPDHDLF